jgi:hypothetical protein
MDFEASPPGPEHVVAFLHGEPNVGFNLGPQTEWGAEVRLGRIRCDEP